MADGQAPDQTQALLQMQSLIASANNTNGKPAPILALLPGGGKDVVVGQGLSLQGGGLKYDATFKSRAQSKPGVMDTLKQQLGLKGSQIFDDIKKCAQGVQAMYTGDMPSGSLPGSSNIQASAAPMSSMDGMGV